MKFLIKNLKETINTIPRKLGYRYLKEDKERNEHIMVRPLESGGYPRFHLFLKIESDNFIFSLHLDQKRPVYKGTISHSADYQGEIIEAEMERIKDILKP